MKKNRKSAAQRALYNMVHRPYVPKDRFSAHAEYSLAQADEEDARSRRSKDTQF